MTFRELQAECRRLGIQPGRSTLECQARIAAALTVVSETVVYIDSAYDPLTGTAGAAPEPVQVEPVQVEPVQVEPVQPETVQPETVQPETVQPETVQATGPAVALQRPATASRARPGCTYRGARRNAAKTDRRAMRQDHPRGSWRATISDVMMPAPRGHDGAGRAGRSVGAAWLKTPDGSAFETDHPDWHSDCVRIPAAEGKRIQRDDSLKTLREILQPGATVYCVLRSVARSGMSRRISFFVSHGSEIKNLDGHISRVLSGVKWGPKQGLSVSGCGMDMGFHVVHNLGRAIWPDGTAEPHGHRNGEPDRDGGYALRHEWL